MIEIKEISKYFWDAKKGEIKAVLPTTLTIKKGEIFGLLGPNGAGKTTLLRMIATILKPSSGTAVVNGFDLLSGQEDIKKSIGFLSGNTKLYGRLTPKELLRYFGELYEMDKVKINERSAELFTLLDMKEFTDKPIEKLSTGQTQKTSIARCLLHDPVLYILDEPTLGLDILTSDTIIGFMKKEVERGKTILFSTHYMEEAESLCSRIALMRLGKILDTGTMDEYRKKWNKPHLREIFMAGIQKEQGENHEN